MGEGETLAYLHAFGYAEPPHPNLLPALSGSSIRLAEAATRDGMAGLTLIHHDWKNTTLQGPTWDRWLEAAQIAHADPRKGLRFSEESHAVAAALAGQGIALCSSVLVADDLKAGRLVTPFDTGLEGFAFYLVHLETTAKRPVIDRFRGWLRGQVAA